jgi:UDP-glucose 4-epimerase
LHYLVTGGAGFIGSHLVDFLLKSNNKVTVIDNLSTGRLENLKHNLNNSKFNFIEGTILDKQLVDSIIRKSDHVFHLAAAVGVFNIVKNPLESLVTNIQGSEIILESCANHRVPVLVTSTSEIYGKNISDSLTEEDDRILGSPLKVRWSYSEAKAIEEVLAYVYWIQNKLPTRIVRLFNTVGPRQSGAYGMVVPRFIQAALSGEPLIVYGDGNQTRCFAHVKDVISALVMVAHSESTIGTVMNVGNKDEISIVDLAKKIIRISNSKSQILFDSYDHAYEPGFEDMQRRVPNTEKIFNLVGWQAKIKLDDIIEDIIKSLEV